MWSSRKCSILDKQQDKLYVPVDVSRRNDWSHSMISHAFFFFIKSTITNSKGGKLKTYCNCLVVRMLEATACMGIACCFVDLGALAIFQMLTYHFKIILVFFHLSPGQLDSAPYTGEGTLDHFEGTLLLKMTCEFWSVHCIWAFNGEHFTHRVMLLFTCRCRCLFKHVCQ